MKPAFRIAVYYALLSGLYIVLSDGAVEWFSGSNRGFVLGWQNLKGISFVLVSAVIIFVLLLHYVRSRNLAEARREQARHSFEQLFKRNPLPAFVFDTTSLEILAVNEAAVEEYGYSEEEFLKLILPVIHPVDDTEKLLGHLARVKAYTYTGHWRHRRRDGSPVEVEIVSHPMPFEGREARLAVAMNISIRKLTEKALADAFVARLDAEEAKTRFLSTISHEMRTPLNAILGFLELLPREQEESVRAEYVAIAQRSAGDLLSLVERLIQAASLTGADNIDHDLLDVELAPFLARIAERYKQPAARKKIGLEFEAETGAPRRAVLDASRVEAILEILIGNAVKFSHGGTIRLSAGRGEGGRTLVFSVADEGIGIPRGQRDRVFESFFQVDQGRARKYGGLGLGLFVARQLCDLIGGSLELKSEDGKGSTFSLVLPGEEDQQGRFVTELKNGATRSGPDSLESGL
jgi:PAS domain S-box-containing protein